MRIAIDASRAVNERAGIGRYSLELIKKLVEVDKVNQYLLLFSFFKSSPYKEKIIKSFKKKNVETKIFRIPGNLKEKIWGWQIPWYEHILNKADIFYAPSFFEVNLGLKIPQVVTIYDMTTFLFPKHRGEEVSGRLNQRTKKACQKAVKIIAISESTKQDLEKCLKINPKKIEVIYPGNADLSQPAKKLPSNLTKNGYLLAVGTIEPRKNLAGLFKAYALLPVALQEKYPLVVAGAEGWQTGEIFETLSQLKLENKVKFLGFVPDGMLARLYKEAALFVYPSLYEGFGFPVLEALSYGVPVVTSNISSLPEVAGKAGVQVSPEDYKSISSALQRLLEHKEEARRLGKMGKAQAEKFTWEKAALKTLKVFEEINGRIER